MQLLPLGHVSGYTFKYFISDGSFTKSHILTVKANVLAGQTNTKFICVISYHDSTTDLDLTHKMDVTFTRVSSGSGIADAICMASDGTIFKNDSLLPSWIFLKVKSFS